MGDARGARVVECHGERGLWRLGEPRGLVGLAMVNSSVLGHVVGHVLLVREALGVLRDKLVGLRDGLRGLGWHGVRGQVGLRGQVAAGIGRWVGVGVPWGWERGGGCWGCVCRGEGGVVALEKRPKTISSSGPSSSPLRPFIF